MGVPLGWLLRRPELRLKVRAGLGRLDREVTWAHSIELADPGPWLDGGELILTTGLRLPEADEDRRDYVRRLAEAGVVAIGFGVGLSHEQVPTALIEAAEETGLPLLEVPLPTPFAAVTKAVMERLAEQQYEGVVQASRVQPRMTRAALTGGAQAVVRELAVSSGTDVVFLDSEGRPRAAHPPGARTPGPDLVAALSPADQTAAAVSNGPDGGVAVQQVRVGPRAHGRLVLVAGRPLTPVDHLLLGHAASLVALEAEKPLRLRDEQHRLNGMFLRLFLDGAIAAPTAREHLVDAGFPVRDGVRVLALSGGTPRRILAKAGEVLAECGLPLFGTVCEGAAVLLLPGGHALTAKAVLDALPAGQTPVAAGLSDVHDQAEGPTALREALNAVSAALARGCGGVVHFASLAGQTLVTAPETRRVLESLAEARLRPLAEYDRDNGTELLASLRSFLEHNGQWEAASAGLGVHRHTLRSRMTRVQTVLGTDLESAHVRAELLLALTAWRGSGRR
ncbi:PucR family transcriptional regulator [Streptomyces sp. NK08204]|uniref:PucR family transcriptional regulator n=1 Tax=Streptomyces sp. NK08204 TaxID=2873260 RepID=UPI001CEC00A4|nr:PucR family transcriptional regulator [Streptomyces sp. NK08204]